MRRVAPVVAALALMASGCSSSSARLPGCSQVDSSMFALMAQSVPTATRLPCLRDLPVGWSFTGAQIRDGSTQLWLDSTIAGVHAVEVDLRETCQLGEAVEVPPAPDEVAMRSYVQPDRPPGFAGVRYLLFEGGCIAYRYRFTGNAPPTLALEAEEALSFLEREAIVRSVEEELDQVLCGASAPRCEG